MPIRKHRLLEIALVVSLVISCSDNPADSNSNNNATSDHTVSKDGVKHKSGLNSPAANCAECHGNELKGGTSGVSCYSCHAKKW